MAIMLPPTDLCC